MTRALPTKYELEQRIEALTALARTTSDADERTKAWADRDEALDLLWAILEHRVP